MNNNFRFYIKYILLTSILLLLFSCQNHVDYLSENDKKYLFYDLGDTIICYNNSDTLFGYVINKEFKIKSHRGPFGGESEYETGNLEIVKLDDPSILFISIELYTDGETSNLGYLISLESLFESKYDCYINEIIYSTQLRNGALIEYSSKEGKYINVDPIAPDTYELFNTDQCDHDNPYKLQINPKAKSLFIYNKTNNLFFRKYKN